MIDRYGAWGQATSLRQMMDRLLQDAVVLPGAGNAQQWAGPAFDVFEEDDNLIVETHLPGLKPEDIDVQVEQGVLTIAGTINPKRRRRSAITWCVSSGPDGLFAVCSFLPTILAIRARQPIRMACCGSSSRSLTRLSRAASRSPQATKRRWPAGKSGRSPRPLTGRPGGAGDSSLTILGESTNVQPGRDVTSGLDIL